MYFIATFFPTFTFGRIKPLNDGDINNLVKQLNPLRNIQHGDVKFFPQTIDLYARVLKGNGNWVKFRDEPGRK